MMIGPVWVRLEMIQGPLNEGENELSFRQVKERYKERGEHALAEGRTQDICNRIVGADIPFL